jgi:predicted CXXCH cytochrome family protein
LRKSEENAAVKKCFIAVAFMFLVVMPLRVVAAELADSDCYACHQKSKASFSEGTVHQPVADGECGACHADHGSANKLTLTSEVPKLCYDCHDPLTDAYQHSPVSEGSCLDCHGVHNAKEKSLLSKSSSELCADCHSDMDKSKGKEPHTPVADAECSECHSSHQSKNKYLLNAPYTQERYLIYKAEAYALCFNCHEKKPFEDNTDDSTSFRNGAVNLHYLHVAGKEEVNKYGIKKRKEGMTCMGCHVTHGSEQAKLVRYNLECGATYCYTLNYRRFDGGGSCVVGCHKPKVYKNASGVIEPATEEAAIPPVAQKSATPGKAPAE